MKFVFAALSATSVAASSGTTCKSLYENFLVEWQTTGGDVSNVLPDEPVFSIFEEGIAPKGISSEITGLFSGKEDANKIAIKLANDIQWTYLSHSWIDSAADTDDSCTAYYKGAYVGNDGKGYDIEFLHPLRVEGRKYAGLTLIATANEESTCESVYGYVFDEWGASGDGNILNLLAENAKATFFTENAPTAYPGAVGTFTGRDQADVSARKTASVPWTSIGYTMSSEQPADPSKCAVDFKSSYIGTDGKQYDLDFHHPLTVDLVNRKLVEIELVNTRNTATTCESLYEDFKLHYQTNNGDISDILADNVEFDIFNTGRAPAAMPKSVIQTHCKGIEECTRDCLNFATQIGWTAPIMHTFVKNDSNNDPESCTAILSGSYLGTDGTEYDIEIFHPLKVDLATRKYVGATLILGSNNPKSKAQKEL
jgi:hypothetical protein